MSTVPRPVKFNTQLAVRPADVDAHEGKLREAAVRLIARLAAGEISVDEFQRDALRIVNDGEHRDELLPWIERALAERKDQVLYRRSTESCRDTLQLLYLEPYEVHPPHCHHNLISNQVCMRGRIYGREYDRVARLSSDRLLLRLVEDRWYGEGEVMQTTEVHRNCHWFAAGEEPAIVLNFYLLGYQAWTFDPPSDTLRKGRRLIDPTVGRQRDGLIVAREIGMDEGYGRFGGQPIDAFGIETLALT